MATFTRGGKKATIRKVGYATVSKTFETKTEARQWALQTEAAMDNGSWTDVNALRPMVYGQMITRYLAEVHPISPINSGKLATMRRMAQEFDRLSVLELTPAFIVNYANNLTNHQTGLPLSGHTVGHHISWMGQVWDYAKTLWGHPYSNLGDNPATTAKGVLSTLGVVHDSDERDRRLEPGEYEALINAEANHWQMRLAIDISLTSCLRLGEVARLHWEDVVWNERLVKIRRPENLHRIKKTKRMKSKSRDIPLLPKFEVVLRAAYEERDRKNDALFEMTAKSLSNRFQRLTKKLGIKDLRFHDLRHEAISRLFEEDLAIPEVARVSGHKDWGELRRYVQLRPSHIVDKL